MDTTQYLRPTSWTMINDPYLTKSVWPDGDAPPVWPAQLGISEYPSLSELMPLEADAFGMMPYGPRQDSLMNSAVRNARHIVAPLKQLLRADVVDMGDNYDVQADLPGVVKGDLDIAIDGHVLTISGERRKLDEHVLDWSKSIERSHGKVTRTLLLPKNANMDAAVASFDGGVLKIVFPKIAGVGHKLVIA